MKLLLFCALDSRVYPYALPWRRLTVHGYAEKAEKGSVLRGQGPEIFARRPRPKRHA